MRHGNFTRRDLTKLDVYIIDKILLAEASIKKLVKHGKRFV